MKLTNEEKKKIIKQINLSYYITDSTMTGDDDLFEVIDTILEEKTLTVSHEIEAYEDELLEKNLGIVERTVIGQVVYDIINLPSLNKCTHESDGLSYTSNPPQSRCVKCKEFYK